MRRFHLVRQTDVSNFSGTGTVVEGVQFSDGTVSLRWLTRYSSHALYESIADVIAIHGHEGATNVEWLDPREPKPDDICADCAFPRSSGRHGPTDECPGCSPHAADPRPEEHHEFVELDV